jgi:hypothetical protein
MVFNYKPIPGQMAKKLNLRMKKERTEDYVFTAISQRHKNNPNHNFSKKKNRKVLWDSDPYKDPF